MEISDKNIAKLAELLDSATPRRVVVVSHFNPDGDAIGSVLAWRRLLIGMGHNVECIVPNNFPSFLAWIEDVDKIRIFKEQPDSCTELIDNAELLFFLDMNNISRLEEMSEPLNRNNHARKVLIDHHLNPPTDYFDVMFSHPESSSTCYLVYKIIERMRGVEVVDTALASALYVGMMTDTGNFTFSFLTPDLYRTIAVLVEKGINIPQINVEIYNSHSEGRLRLLGYALGPKMEVFEEGRAACISLSEYELNKHSYQPGDTEGFVNYPLSIKGVLITAMFTQTHKYIRASFRSRGDMDVNVFARQYFNGGGHKNAAGGKCYLSLKQTVNYFKESVAEYFAELGIK